MLRPIFWDFSVCKIANNSHSYQGIISVNGRHQGISVIIKGVEIVFDNLHPEGLPREIWIANLQFDTKVRLGREFEITEENF